MKEFISQIDLTRANARNPSQEKISVIQKSPKATFDSSSPRH